MPAPGSVIVMATPTVTPASEWISPAAFEYCDGEDNDCNGVVDDGDADGDGVISIDCGGTDCDDADPDEYPGAPEFPDWLDNNCSGTIDETCDWSCSGTNDYDHDGVLDCSDDWDWWYAYGGDVSYMGTCTL